MWCIICISILTFSISSCIINLLFGIVLHAYWFPVLFSVQRYVVPKSPCPNSLPNVYSSFMLPAVVCNIVRVSGSDPLALHRFICPRGRLFRLIGWKTPGFAGPEDLFPIMN
ncbi:hypothetical protein Hanom_Chr14g01314891 [Helianthus anomalus]